MLRYQVKKDEKMAIKICEKCFKEFSSILLLDGKNRNLQNRKYCLECSPYGSHNTLNFNKNKPDSIEKGKICPSCKEFINPEQYYRRRDNKNLSVYCKFCTNKQSISRFRETKKQAVEYKGGKCERCGYNKCIAAMDFHHLDPSQKDFSISNAKNKSFDKIKNELDKCILVCSNCHREIHSEEMGKYD